MPFRRNNVTRILMLSFPSTQLVAGWMREANFSREAIKYLQSSTRDFNDITNRPPTRRAHEKCVSLLLNPIFSPFSAQLFLLFSLLRVAAAHSLSLSGVDLFGGGEGNFLTLLHCIYISFICVLFRFFCLFCGFLYGKGAQALLDSEADFEWKTS